MARRYAILRKRFAENQSWETSGWRGIGHYELTKALGSSYEYLPEKSRARHRLLSRFGLPAALFDPYPLFIFRKI
jgi:hypothetical protein